MQTPIQLVQIIDRLNVGGPTPYLLFLSRALESRGYRSTVVKGQVASGEAEMDDVIRRSGIRPLELCGFSRAIVPIRDFRVLIALYRLLRRVRPEIVHTHKSKAGVVGRIAAWLAGVPVTLHTFHGLVFKGYFSAWKTRLIVLVERLLARRTDVLVAVSALQRDELLADRIAAPSRIRTVPLGVDLDPFVNQRRGDAGFREELGFGASTRLVGIVARLVPIKGVDVFLSAAEQVAAALPDVRFVVIGDGELRGALESLARERKLSGRVRFTGFRNDMARIYGSLDLSVLSSRHEGLPVALLESVASGCYVVATRVGGVPDLLRSERIGLMVAPDNARALAAGIQRVLRERREISAEVRREIVESYGMTRLAEDFSHLYRKLSENKRTGGGSPGDCWEGKYA
ncbi:MAG: glycosyltransferase [Candidatus Latescibacteria bacterium]|nr:glycosyltransferase [Candidatus Latescibacterota bacterium]